MQDNRNSSRAVGTMNDLGTLARMLRSHSAASVLVAKPRVSNALFESMTTTVWATLFISRI